MARQSRKLLVWVAALGAVGLVIYAMSSSGGVAYGEAALRDVVDFSGMNASQRRAALTEANAARCTCGCGLGLAECVSTDATCPIRMDNISRIRRMVAAAMQ